MFLLSNGENVGLEFHNLVIVMKIAAVIFIIGVPLNYCIRLMLMITEIWWIEKVPIDLNHFSERDIQKIVGFMERLFVFVIIAMLGEPLVIGLVIAVKAIITRPDIDGKESMIGTHSSMFFIGTTSSIIAAFLVCRLFGF